MTSCTFEMAKPLQWPELDFQDPHKKDRKEPTPQSWPLTSIQAAVPHPPTMHTQNNDNDSNKYLYSASTDA